VVLPGRFSNNFSENLASSEDTIPTRRPGIRLPGRLPSIPVLRGHSSHQPSLSGEPDRESSTAQERGERERCLATTAVRCSSLSFVPVHNIFRRAACAWRCGRPTPLPSSPDTDIKGSSIALFFESMIPYSINHTQKRYRLLWSLLLVARLDSSLCFPWPNNYFSTLAAPTSKRTIGTYVSYSIPSHNVVASPYADAFISEATSSNKGIKDKPQALQEYKQLGKVQSLMTKVRALNVPVIIAISMLPISRSPALQLIFLS